MTYNVLRSQIKRHSSEFLEFNSLLREHHLLAPAYDFFDMTDIRFRFYTQPSFQPLVSSQGLFGVTDLRFYINGIDYTKYFQKELRFLITQVDQKKIKAQYKRAASAWITYLDHYKDSLSLNITREKDILTRLLAESDVGNQLSVFGSKDFGFGSNLHIINYLFKDIEIDPLSLKRIINYRQKDLGKPEIDFSSFENLKLTISQGPAPSFDVFDAEKTQPRGRIFYFLEYIYNNPIEELLQLILKKITDTQNWVELQRTNYLEPLKNQVDTLETETKEKFDGYTLKINNLTKVIQENFAK